jgi:hypothetical protein
MKGLLLGGGAAFGGFEEPQPTTKQRTTRSERIARFYPPDEPASTGLDS